MKGNLGVIAAFILILQALQIQPCLGMSNNVSLQILERTDIMEDTGWMAIDLSQYSPWEQGVRNIYLEMYVGNRSSCVGDSLFFAVRSVNDPASYRVQPVVSIHADPQNTDNHFQYVWLGINSSNKIEYQVDNLGCSTVDVQLRVVGFE